MNIATAVPNTTYEVTDSLLETKMKERLYALGLIPGQKLVIVRKGIGGDPIQVRIGATEIMLRKHVAEQIKLKITD